ncbi:MAG: N-acetyltransferase GCN5 [Halanaerobium sp. 4-GBenrich]|jgi:ribosomal protein S18 acetylase RimI-like enzyme|uniref:Acetyltransferase (GNAT) domain-containing protein n=1 Tax=Halanaerobium congolense TaxID=54121 RepID=A0A1M7L3R7_9FIRM|nr:GNAT family N-acetyltransferase [Halanaerobium congolense]KXS50030.1 MAG: N-acetyltransferase GCN5 [Halanaerobium sp. T82-1]ODS49870.1 MAG: N-acetyltransferase GCN5 [Halanaerobium sp. 4-GBenrich]OEG63480.1 MAG: GNAT family N-acetyltransferase [Halanaerobium sp. MDAL1]PUU91989.1 MAG: N-acetyltransferase GCN5 [Halanaerobium sp.]PTX17660.1 acetyltransferase (GNAT) family protein [Halanaerobium congolense]
MMTALSKDLKYDCRQAILSDAAEIHNLMQLAFADYAKRKNENKNKKEVINSALREQLSEVKKDLEANIVLVLTDSDKIIASLRLEEISNKRYLLKRFAVSPSYQNQGLGTMLFQEAVEKLRKIDALYLQLYSSLENEKLICFYQGLGFNCLETDNKKGYERGLWIKTIK